MIALHRCSSPLGPLTMASDGQALTGLWLEGQKYYAATLPPDAQEANDPLFCEVERWLNVYFEGENPAFQLPLAPIGSPFRQAVWRHLLDIPYGQLVTYGALAKALAVETGRPVSAQAVGGAVGHNPISILIPCHRVVGADGSLTGYAGGVEKKQQLLSLEGRLFDDAGRALLR